MTQPDSLGICPACEHRGPVGQACDSKLCQRRGYHHIPLIYAPVSDEPPDRRIGQRWDAYLIVQKVGDGGVGTVYKALQPSIMLEAALKVVSTDSASLAGRFRQEASALARLNHPNIVRLLHFGERRGEPFLVMEFVPGDRTLEHVSHEGLSIARVFTILNQLVDALEAAHLLGIVHRDVKPANVMLQPLPSHPDFVRLVDFGLAKFTESGGSTRISAGTPAYMAPEQVTRRQLGPWTDWYALGVITFELLTGHRAYPADSTMEVIEYKTRPDYRPWEQPEASHLPEQVIAALRQLMAHDPSNRASEANVVRALLSGARDAMAAAFGEDYECRAGRQLPAWAQATSIPKGRPRRTLLDAAATGQTPGEPLLRPTLLTPRDAIPPLGQPKATLIDRDARQGAPEGGRQTLFYGTPLTPIRSAEAVAAEGGVAARPGRRGDPIGPIENHPSTEHGPTSGVAAVAEVFSSESRDETPGTLEHALANRHSMPLRPVDPDTRSRGYTELVSPRAGFTKRLVGGASVLAAIVLALLALWWPWQDGPLQPAAAIGAVDPGAADGTPAHGDTDDPRPPLVDAGGEVPDSRRGSENPPPDAGLRDALPDRRPREEPGSEQADAGGQGPTKARPRQPTGRDWLERGRHALKRGDWQRARDAFLRIPHKTSHFAQAVLELAAAARDQQSQEEVLRLLDDAQQLRPRFAPIHEARANVLHRQGQKIAACGEWRRALQIDPTRESVRRVHDRLCKLSD